MRMLHVLRKPLSEGTVAANTLRHGCGGLNIDASRVDASDHFGGGAKMSSSGHTLSKFDLYEKGSGWVAGSVSGRWPANVILQHLDGCRCAGIKKVRGSFSGKKSARDDLNQGHDEIYRAYGTRSIVAYNDEDGKETVANWICEPGCPVARLDADSLAGGMHSAGSSRSAKREAGKTGMFPMDGDGHRFGDSGGASRFFKQIGGKADG